MRNEKLVELFGFVQQISGDSLTITFSCHPLLFASQQQKGCDVFGHHNVSQGQYESQK